MEERSPSSDGKPSVNPPLGLRPINSRRPPRPIPSGKRSVNLSLPTQTYIIQVPKDQIFSVPPLQNAAIVESFRNPEKKSRPCCKWMLYIFITLVVLAVIIGVSVGMVRAVFTLKVPSFSIGNIVVKNPPSGSKKGNPGYEIMLKAKNTNGRTGVSYGSDGDATLLYKNHKIGNGSFPWLDQNGGGSDSIQLSLSGWNNGALPEDIETSIQDKKGKNHVSLILKLKVPVKLSAGDLSFGSNVIDVVCDFKVSSLGAGKNNVLSQECEAKFQ